MSEQYSFQDVLGDPVTIRSWSVNGLPRDKVSVWNAVSLLSSRRWPLCIDPQGQARNWIRTQFAGPQFKILSPSMNRLSRYLQAAVSAGQVILLENVGESLDPLLEPILRRQTYVAIME